MFHKTPSPRPPRKLDTLPLEIIRRIAYHGPFTSALTLALVNSTLYKACLDWSVFKGITENNGNGTGWKPNWEETLIERKNSIAFWGPWAHADFNAKRCEDESSEIQMCLPAASWVPHLIAMGHPLPGPKHIKYLARIQPNFHITCESLAIGFAIAGCSLSAQQVFDDVSRVKFHSSLRGKDGDVTKRSFDPSSVLGRIGNIPDVFAGQHETSSSILCTAYIAIGTLYYEIMFAITKHQIPQKTYLRHRHPIPEMIPLPPLSTIIPFRNFITIPIPFWMDRLRDFNMSYIPVMTTKEFFEEGTWSGYMGADSTVLQREFPYFDIPIDGLKFSASINTADPNILYLNSDGDSLALPGYYKFEGLIRKDTGLLQLKMHNFDEPIIFGFVGIMTPFGMILTLPGGSSMWMWLWKSEWAAGRCVKWEPRLTMEEYLKTLPHNDGFYIMMTQNPHLSFASAL